MIHRLRGILVEKSPTSALVDVGGVGYGLSISLNTFDRLPASGETASVRVHTYVREDRLQLFGFADSAEQEMFELLIAVSGIGPSSAQTILSGMTVGDLQKAIYREQVAELTQIRGVGPKMAQRVVVELRDKIRLPIADLDDGDDPPPAAPADPIAEDACKALEGLGIAPNAAIKAVTAARKKLDDSPTVQDLIKVALRDR